MGIVPAKQIIQQEHEVRCRLVAAHLRESDNVGKEDADIFQLVHVEFPKMNQCRLRRNFRMDRVVFQVVVNCMVTLEIRIVQVAWFSVEQNTIAFYTKYRCITHVYSMRQL